MIKSWIKYMLYFVGVCFLLTFCGVYWLAVEADKALRVMGRFGGIDVVGDWSITPAGIDDIYVRSLRLKAQEDIVYDIRALDPCVEYSRDCMVQEAAGINLYLMSTKIVLRDVDEFLDKYRADVGIFDGGCPVVHETTALVKEIAMLRHLPDEKVRIIARERIEKINNDGGLTYSLATPACRRFFRKKPYMARTYTIYLALLMRVAEGTFSASWAFLAGLPNIGSTVR
jgi:hypothetical protein